MFRGTRLWELMAREVYRDNRAFVRCYKQAECRRQGKVCILITISVAARITAVKICY